MDEYEKFSDWEFFFHCVSSERQFFLKNALRRQYFDSDFMHREQMTIWLMERLNSGKNILYPLNLLRFGDFRKWSFP